MLGSVERQHAGADHLSGREAGIIDGERFRISHNLNAKVAPGDQPASQNGSPGHRFLFSNSSQMGMRIG
jgi:hypothetical protein